MIVLLVVDNVDDDDDDCMSICIIMLELPRKVLHHLIYLCPTNNGSGRTHSCKNS